MKCSLALLVLLLVACQAREVDEPRRTDHQEILEALENARRGDIEKARGGPIDVRGYNFHWQLEPGGGTKVVIVSRNLGGSLLVFSENGALLVERECDEVTSVQWVDLDADGEPEWITEEIDGRGTGLLVKVFKVYRHAGDGIQLLWTGLSYDRRMAADSFRQGLTEIEVKRGFLKLEPHSGGSILLHWVLGPTEEGEEDIERTAYVWVDGRIEVQEGPAAAYGTNR